MIKSTRELVLEDSERCVRCGSCKALCPTFAQDLTEGMSARGRVVLGRALLMGELEPSALLGQRLFSCLLCGLCEPLCPVGVDVTGIVYHALGLVAKHDPRNALMRSLMRRVFMKPDSAFSLARRVAPMAMPVLRRTLPFDIKLPAARLKQGTYPSEGSRRGRVALFAGCAVSFVYPELGRALIRALNCSGYEVLLPETEACCGAPLRAMGMEDDAKSLARKNIAAFGRLDVEAVLSLCPTCTLSIKKHFPALIGEGLSNAMDAMEFLSTRYLINSEAKAIEGPVVYHDPCHLGSGLGVREAPREFLKRAGVHLEKGPPAPPCCGFSQCMGYADISNQQLGACEDAYETASTIITACPGCMAQLGRLKGKRVMHAVELA